MEAKKTLSRAQNGSEHSLTSLTSIREKRNIFTTRMLLLVVLLGCIALSLLGLHRFYSALNKPMGLPADLPLDASKWDQNLGFQAVDKALPSVRQREPQRTRLAPPPVLQSIIQVAENDSCRVPRAPGGCEALGLRGRVHLVVVSAMWEREPHTKMETQTMVKTVISQTKCKLWLHFMVAGNPEAGEIQAMMADFGAWMILPYNSSASAPMNPTNPRLRRGYVNATIPGDPALLYSLHYINPKHVQEAAKRLNLYPLAHHAGVPGMSKFFIHEILWQVKQAIYLDVDMLVAGDIQDLWALTKEFDTDKRLLYYMGNNHPEGHNKRRLLRPYCSCQLVMDLERMRRVNMTNLVVRALKGRAIKSLREYVEDGDQFLFMWICKKFKDLCRILPRMWNVSGCSKPVPFLGLNDRGMQANETCWRIVHFNCMGHKNMGNGVYRVPKGWREAMKWAESITIEDLRKPHHKQDWKRPLQ